MQTQCTLSGLELEAQGRRSVEITFDAGHVSSDGGALLLREVDRRFGLSRSLASCFTDSRDPEWIEFSVEQLVRQRVFGLALGYEDLNDHDQLRHDPLLGLAVGRHDVLGGDRRNHARDGGKALAGKSTLNRIERSADATSRNGRYHKVVVDTAACDRLLVDLFVQQQTKAPRRLVIDVDASDIPLHGDQLGRFYHGYYHHHCYLPQYYFIDEWPVGIRLNKADKDAAAGCIGEVERIVKRLREKWPKLKVTLRGDSGFTRDEIMTWCESNNVDYIFGLAGNKRLIAEISAALEQARKQTELTKKPARNFRDFTWRTLDSWSRERRVVGKAETLPGKDNPRFVVTSLTKGQWGARDLYEKLYCARGEMENHIKEQQLDLFGTRASTHTMPSNQLRLYFTAFAHALMLLVRVHTLQSTVLAKATVATIRARLLKVGATFRVSVRRFHIALSQSFPMASHLRQALVASRGSSG